MNINVSNIKSMFLQQSYQDATAEYLRSLHDSSYIPWDIIIITASNEQQAETYREQIEYRLKNELLPRTTHYAVIPDLDGKRIGSGGATLNLLRYIAEKENKPHPFEGIRVLVIHSGGDSKRIPQYSACGKLFSPMPRELPDGRPSSLFDELIIGMSLIPSRIREGMLTLSGDVLLLFNPLQIDFEYKGAAAISIKVPVEIGAEHGVYLSSGDGYVSKFMHKHSIESLQKHGAINDQNCVDLDTGAVIMDSSLMDTLYSLVCTNGKPDAEKFAAFVNDKVRMSFYGDFLYPLAENASFEEFMNEPTEGERSAASEQCRKAIWESCSRVSMKLFCLSPAEFIHFGTTGELLRFVTEDVKEFYNLGWKKCVASTIDSSRFAVHNAYIGKRAIIHDGAYIEDSYILGTSIVGKGSIVSNLHLVDQEIPPNSVWHGLKLSDGTYVVRIYGIDDNPKSSASILGKKFSEFCQRFGLNKKDLWDNEKDSLWDARLYAKTENMDKAIDMSHILYEMITNDTVSPEKLNLWKNTERVSLCQSFNQADELANSSWRNELETRILVRQFLNQLDEGLYYSDALKVFGARGITKITFDMLMGDAKEAGFSTRIRIYYAISRYMEQNRRVFDGYSYNQLMSMCYETISDTIAGSLTPRHPDFFQIKKDSVEICMPVRVNWGGGWTDTPPYCIEQGGTVLNAAIKLKGEYPIHVVVKKISELRVEFESTDIHAKGFAEEIQTIRSCSDPFDPFTIHKATLISCGVIPMEGDISLKKILKQLGGGIYISTAVTGVPKGSGLGTSSILAGACVKGILALMDVDLPESEIFNIVLCAEQLMSTGGGWQDQVGGLVNGIKIARTNPGASQQIAVTPLQISEITKKELQDRFALIYSGQRRLARNLLREVVGNYIGSDPKAVDALNGMRTVSEQMKTALESGNIDKFAILLNKHWELSKQLDANSTNTCIDQIFLAIEDLIDGKFIAGAGGGGFMQVIMKHGVTREMLSERINMVFQGSGTAVWDSEFDF